VTSPDANRLLRVSSWARLAVVAGLLAVGPVLPPALLPATRPALLAIALLAAVISASVILLRGPGARPDRLVWMMCVLDVVLVTAIVAATGGARSIFTFLYVLAVISACVLLSRPGGLAMAGLASAFYIALVFGGTVFPLIAFFEPPLETTGLEVLTMFMNAGTFLAVAIVAGSLAERFRETREELEVQQRDLRDLQAFKDVIFHSVGTGLIALDRERRITAFNRAAEEITGRTAAQAVGRPGDEVFGNGVPLDVIESAIATSSRAAARHETTVRRPDGGAVPVRLTFSALTSGDGRRLGLIAACEDLSVIREMETRMREADRLATLGRMAANIAHEIRNPLASLSGAVEALGGPTGTDQERTRLTDIALRESERLNEIVTTFVDYARPVPLSLVDLNVADVLDEILILLEHRSVPAGIKIGRDFPHVLHWRLDPQQFRQAVWNLCLNGVEAMTEGGELTVAAALTAGGLRVSVSDTGDGITATDLRHVFEPFYSTKPGGSGLGLALVHRIVTEHGGRVEARSEPGLGTTMTLTIPASHA
jgi:two-component system, NtrC family, sensor histidine kinase PilS